jgi:hypothetical protein
MIPMIDMMLAPGMAATVISVGPALLGVGLAMVGGVAWLAHATSEELRRIAAREWDVRKVAATTHTARRLAA